MRIAFAASAVVSALALAACAATETGDRTADQNRPAAGMAYEGPGQPRQCFSVSQVSNYTRGERNQVFLRVGARDVYELSAAGGCPDLDFAQRIALVTDGGTVGSRLCTNDWAQVVVPGSTSRVSACRVRISRQLTEAEVAALPPRHRP